MINIENLTNEILNEKKLSSKYKNNWLDIRNFYILYLHGTQGQKAKWLTYDQLLEADLKLSYSIQLFDINIDYKWLPDLKKILNTWKSQNDKYLIR